MKITIGDTITDLAPEEAVALAYSILQQVSAASPVQDVTVPRPVDFAMHDPVVMVRLQPKEGSEPLICITARDKVGPAPAAWLWFTSEDAASLATLVLNLAGSSMRGRSN